MSVQRRNDLPPPFQPAFQSLLDLDDAHLALSTTTVMTALIPEETRTRCLPLLADLLRAAVLQETTKKEVPHD